MRADLDHQFMAAIQLAAPALSGRLADCRRAEDIRGTADLANFFRKPYGPGWALVGDAGYHKDPAAAHGISDAFRDADLLAQAVYVGLCGEMPMDAALTQYEERRNEDAFPLYEESCAIASLAPPPASEFELRMALRDGDHADVDMYVSANFGTISTQVFRSPDNLARIFRAAGRPPP